MEGIQNSSVTPSEQCSQGNRKCLILVTLGTAIGSFLFGYDLGIIGAVNIVIEDEWHLSVIELDVIVSITMFGAIFGALVTAKVSDKFGRKFVTEIADLFFLLSSIMMALAQNMAVLILGRLILGFGFGIVLMIAPVYLSETGPEHIRGAMISITILCQTAGRLIAYAVAIALGDQWRWMLGLAAIPPVISFFVFVILLPESPQYYVKVGMIEKARKALMQLRLPSEASDDPALVEQELQEIQNQNSLSLALHSSGYFTKIWFLFKNHRYQAITLIVLFSLQQFVGINCINEYGPQLMQMDGFDDSNRQAILASLPIAIANFFGSIVAVYVIDVIGRRGILLWSLPAVFISLVLLGSFFAIQYFHGFIGSEFVLLAFLLMYAFFSIGIRISPVVVLSEIIPLEFRSTASSLANAAMWLTNFFVSMAFLPMASTSEGMITLWLILASFAMISYMWVYFRLPETKGHLLEESKYLLHKGR